MSSSSNTDNVLLKSPSETYLMSNGLGKGGFGSVYKCVNKRTKTDVAIKFLLKCSLEDYQSETEFLQRLKPFSENFNFVHMFETFVYDQDIKCIVCEVLDISLLKFVKTNEIGIYNIRYILAQLLVGLSKLDELDIIHNDLKLDNIMLVDPVNHPFRVKIIDFGNALNSDEAREGCYGQIYRYRCPEIFFLSPMTPKSDMWSLGCITAELMLKTPLYPGTCEYDQVRLVSESLGLPPTDLLEKNLGATLNFVKDDDGWRLKTPTEYKMHLSSKYREGCSSRPVLRCLDEVAERNIPPNLSGDELWAEKFQRVLVVDLIKQMLQWDPDTRISADRALQHRATSQFAPPREKVEKPTLKMEGSKPLRRPKGMITGGLRQPSPVTFNSLRRPHS